MPQLQAAVGQHSQRPISGRSIPLATAVVTSAEKEVITDRNRESEIAAQPLYDMIVAGR